ncbi:MAG TPA: amidase [Kofleriaceae bacterium]|nr:amidase [Kofleriaceae bacterium]
MTAPDLVRFDAHRLSELIHARRASCVEVMTAYLDQIDRLNPQVNAIVSLQPRDALLAEAAARDAALARGESAGWLHGLPIAVKDLLPTRGVRTTWGSPLFAEFVPDADAIAVERMRRAGAILIGKTNVPEFGLGSQTYNEVFGTTRNAYDPTRAAGGSSGGAAVALALRMLPLADGSDHAGSLRNPAAFNNVLGFRPTFGCVPSAEGDVFLPALGVIGPMARTATDLALLLSVLAGADPRTPLASRDSPARFAAPLDRDVTGTRIGWLGDLGGHLPFEPGVLELARAALGAFETLGCTVEGVRLDHPVERVWQSWLVLRAYQVGSVLKVHHTDPARWARIKPEARWEIERGARLTAYELADAQTERTAWYNVVRRLFDRFDYLVLPSAQVFPFDAGTHWPRQIAGRDMDTYHRWMEVVVPITMAGSPALNVPAGFSPDGLPMGIQLVGRPHDELGCLQLAHAYEQATGWVARRPPPLAGVA